MGAWEDGFAAGYAAAAVRRGENPDAFRTELRMKQTRATTPKKTRKLTAHNRFMSKELKKLKKKHPRTSQKQLFKKANAAWRRKKRR